MAERADDLINHYEKCLNEFKDFGIKSSKTFSPNDIRDGLNESLLYHDWNSAAIILKEMSQSLCKSNERAVWKAGMYLGLVHPKATDDTIDSICESAFYFCEVLRSEVVLEHMIYHMHKHNFNKAIEIAEKLDKPKRGAKKRHENPINVSESFKNRVILDLIKYYKAMAELGSLVKSTYELDGTQIIIPSLLNRKLVEEIHFQEPLPITSSQSSDVGANILAHVPLISDIGEETLTQSQNITSQESVDLNRENVEDKEYDSFLGGSEISSLLDKWLATDDDSTIPHDTSTEKGDGALPLQVCQDDDYQSEISASFLSTYVTGLSLRGRLTPTPKKTPKKSPMAGKGGKRRKLLTDPAGSSENFTEEKDILIAGTMGAVENCEIQGVMHSHKNLGTKKKLTKVCQTFENCLSTINFVPEDQIFPDRSYVAWDIFVDLHIGVLIYLENFDRAKHVLDHFLSLYPNYWIFHEMAVNLYLSYSDKFAQSETLLMSHMKILISKDPTNPYIFNLCELLIANKDYVQAATNLFDYMDRTMLISSRHETSPPLPVKSLLQRLARECLNDPTLKEQIDLTWKSESYRNKDWFPPDNSSQLNNIEELCP